MKTEKREIDGTIRTIGMLDIDWKEQMKPVEILRLTFGEDLKVRNACTKISMTSGQPNVTVDQEKMTLMNLKNSIIKAPFPITEKDIGLLDKMVAGEILEAFNELNNPTEKKKES